MKRLLLTTIAAAALTAPALAQTTPPMTPESADGAYIKFIAMDSQGEIMLSQLALQKSQDPQVKAFAQRMIADHTTTIGKASALAKTAGTVNYTVAPTDDAQVEYAHLMSYTGHDFDVEYMTHNVKDHGSDIETTRHAMEVSSNGDVKAFEMQQLPLLEDHLRMAERAFDSVAANRD